MPIATRRPHQWNSDTPVAVKPHFRGWQHVVATPLSLAAAIVVTVLAPTTATRWASAAYLTTSLLLFGISSIYHRFYWTPSWERFWRSLDHSNIFLLIAGTYTPLCVALLPTSDTTIVLTLVWVGAFAGILQSIFWPTAPRWLTVALYVGLGWLAIWYVPKLWAAGGAHVVILIAAGGLLYTIGAVVYGLKRPNPSPKWFGFHEIFHTFTILAWACQCVAVYFAVLGANTPTS